MIEARNLSMHYGSTLALDHVSFSAKEKEVVGLLGPNGAGKTTLMRILTTFIYPSQGTATVSGFDLKDDPLAVRREIGYLPEVPPLYMDMRVDDYVLFVGRARGLSGADLKKRREWAAETLGISGVWKHMIAELSLGYRQRVGLAQALIHDPKVVILDEPTSGLDPMQIVSIRHLIRELAREKTVIFSTHILQEASAVSDRLLIIDRGRIIAQGTIEELKKERAGEPRLAVAVQGPRLEVEAALRGVPALKSVVFQGQPSSNTCTFIVGVAAHDEGECAVYQAIKEKGWILKEVYPKEPSLEEIFLGLFRKER